MVDLVRNLGGTVGFGENILNRNDDGSTGPIDITGVFGGPLDFFGVEVSEVFVNNNGNITLNGPLGTFTPSQITGGSIPGIFAYFADVDTGNGSNLSQTPGGTSQGTNLVYYDLDTVNNVFTVTYDDVGFFSGNNSLQNAFQIRLIGTGDGNFDIEFRYEDINWTTGNASGGTNGLGGTVARAGYTAGTGEPGSFFELSQSGVQEAMLALEDTPGNTGIDGLYRFSVTDGSIAPVINITGPAAQFEGSNPPATTPFTFTVSRTGSVSGDLDLNYRVDPFGFFVDPAEANDIDGANLNPADPFLTGTVTIPDGFATATFTVDVLHDTRIENDEWFIVTLTDEFEAGPETPGDLDVVLARTDGGTAGFGDKVLLNDDDGTFSDSGETFDNLVTASTDVKLAFFNDDEFLDAIITGRSEGGNSTRVWFGQGDGTFTDSGETYADGEGVAVGEVTGDAFIDAVIVPDSGNLIVLENNGSGIFTPVNGDFIQPAVTAGTDIALGNFDDDDDLEAIVTQSGDNPNLFLENDGTGQYSLDDTFGPSESFHVEIGLINGDDQVDAITADGADGVRAWNGLDGSLFGGSPFGAPGEGFSANAVALGFLNDDAFLDVFVGYGGAADEQAAGNANNVFFGNGDGTFTDSDQSLGLDHTLDVALGDLDGDGDIDAFVANGNGTGMADRVWLNDGDGFFTESEEAYHLNSGTSEGVDLGDLDLDTRPGAPAPTFGNRSDVGIILDDDGLPPPPPRGREADIFGDPHLVTLDGLGYSFQAAGEFILTRATSGDPLEIQVRTEPLGDVVSINTAVATQIGDVRVTIDATADQPLRLNGQVVTFEEGQTSVVAGDGSVFRNGDVFTIVYETGEQLKVTLYDSGRLDICLALSEDRADGSFEGLLGNLDGDTTNDLALSDGTVLTQPVDFDELYGAFADGWRITQEESLFDYEEGQSTDTFQITDFPTQVISVDDLPEDLVAEAEALLDDAGVTDPILRDQAIVDIVLTGDASFAEGAANLAADPEVQTDPANTPAAVPIIGISADSNSQPEGNAGTTEFTFTVYRIGDTEGALEVDFEVTGSGIDPANAADFDGDLPSGSVAFADGEDATTITVEVSGDDVAEFDEGFTVSITTDAEGVLVAAGQASSIIENDDGTPESVFSIELIDEPNPGAPGDDGLFTFNVIRRGSTLEEDSVDVGFSTTVLNSGGTEIEEPLTVSFGIGQTVQTVDVAIEDTETDTVTATLANPVGGTIDPDDGSAEGTAIPFAGFLAPEVGEVEFSVTSITAPVVATEGTGADTPRVIRITRTGETNVAASVVYTISGGSGDNPASPSDFAGVGFPTGTVNFAAGQTVADVTVFVSGDSNVEEDETFLVTLSDATAQGVTAAAGEGLEGTIVNDDPFNADGTADKDRLDLAGGIDRIDGGPGNDRLEGGAGDDIILGSGGRDRLNGGNDNDLLSGGEDRDKLFGGNGNDLLDGGTGRDKLEGGAGNDLLNGGNDKDKLRGGEGDDTLNGGNGRDNLRGEEGNDSLSGDGDRDKLRGGDGDDTLDGGADRDKLRGDAGADTFIYEEGDGRDKIKDFNVAEDILDLSGVDGLETLADLEAALIKDRGKARFDFGDGDLLVVNGLNVDDLAEANIILN